MLLLLFIYVQRYSTTDKLIFCFVFVLWIHKGIQQYFCIYHSFELNVFIIMSCEYGTNIIRKRQQMELLSQKQNKRSKVSHSDCISMQMLCFSTFVFISMIICMSLMFMYLNIMHSCITSIKFKECFFLYIFADIKGIFLYLWWIRYLVIFNIKIMYRIDYVCWNYVLYTHCGCGELI